MAKDILNKKDASIKKLIQNNKIPSENLRLFFMYNFGLSLGYVCGTFQFVFNEMTVFQYLTFPLWQILGVYLYKLFYNHIKEL